MTSERFLPGASQEIPGLDPNWTTIKLHRDQTSGVLAELEVGLVKGEAIQFELTLYLVGAAATATTLTVLVPPSSNGNFNIEGADAEGSITRSAFGADEFNTAVGALRTGDPDSTQSYDEHVIVGSVGAKSSGMLRFAIASGRAKSGSLLRYHRLKSSREYGVPA